MVHDLAKWRMAARRARMALILAALPFACLDGPAVHAQSIMRSPSINIESRIPTINPAVAPRVNPNIAARTVTTVGRTTPRIDATAVMRTTPRIGAMTLRSASQIGVRSLPYVRYSPNLYPACAYAYRAGDGACLDQPVTSADGGSGGPPGKKAGNSPRRNGPQTAALSSPSVTNEIVAEIDGAPA